MPSIPASLRALLQRTVDYAGLFPPASLPLDAVLRNYGSYLASSEAWMLNRLVLRPEDLGDPGLKDTWRVTLLVDGEPGALPPQVETLETKKDRRLSLPTYCEVPIEQVANSFVKFRMGGLTPGAIPAAEDLAASLSQAALRRIPFKATAGLHHPLRAARPLTYEADSPRATMHGFINVFAAAAFIWSGMTAERAAEVLKEEDAAAFEFGVDGLLWRGRAVSTTVIRTVRQEFAHAFGSCSFEEPVMELRELGLLP